MNDKQNISERINTLVSRWNLKWEKYVAERFPNLVGESAMTREDGKRYAKLLKKDSGGSNSAYGFIDLNTGDIYKAASWKAPAKGIRWSVMVDDFGMSVCDPYGVVYLRGPSINW